MPKVCCCFVVSLLSDQLAQPEGTVTFLSLFVLLQVSSGMRRVGQFYRTWGCRDCYILHGLESASRMGGEVSSSVFDSWGSRQLKSVFLLRLPSSSSLWGSRQLKSVFLLRLPSSSSLWGSRQLKESCHFGPSQNASVVVFVCLRLRLSSSSSAYVFVCLKLQALVYDILPSTTAVFSYAIGSRKLSTNEQFFDGAQSVIRLLHTTQIKQGVSFIAANKVYTGTNKTTIV